MTAPAYRVLRIYRAGFDQGQRRGVEILHAETLEAAKKVFVNAAKHQQTIRVVLEERLQKLRKYAHMNHCRWHTLKETRECS